MVMVMARIVIMMMDRGIVVVRRDIARVMGGIFRVLHVVIVYDVVCGYEEVIAKSCAYNIWIHEQPRNGLDCRRIKRILTRVPIFL